MPNGSTAVVIVHYQTWAACLACLDSLMAQALPDTTVIVVDNCSSNPPSDDLFRIAPNLELKCNPRNIGFAAAANQGIQEAQRRGAEYIWMLNPDTLIQPGAQDALIETVRQDPAIGAVGSILLEEGDDQRIQAWGGGLVSSLSGLPRHLVLPDAFRLSYICGASMLLRSRALDAVGGFDEDFFLYWEDTDLCFRLRKRGWRLAVAESSKVVHRQSLATVFQSPLYDRHFTESSVRFFKKHYSYWPFPVLVSSCGRSLKRLVKGKRNNAWAVCQGLTSGLSTTSRPG